MNPRRNPFDWTPIITKDAGPVAVLVLVVYNNVAAAVRATQVIEDLGRKVHGKMLPQVRPVLMDYLHDPVRFERSLADAATADIVIVSLSGPASLPAMLKKWIATSMAQKRKSNSAVIALLGPLDENDQANATHLHLLKNSTNAAGFDICPPPAEAGVFASFFECVG